jgi:hypothetical protein
MIDVLRALLDGRMTRAQAEAWARRPGQIFDSPSAAAVFEALASVDERDDAGELVREVELRAYLDALAGGERFFGDPDPLVCLRLDLDTLAERVGATPIRWWSMGLGWTRELRFAALASGRPFVAIAHEPERVDVHTLARAPWRDALVELFEHLAIDEREAIAFGPRVELGELPVWVLWRQDDNGNQVEMDRFRSYAKAELHERIYTDRAHRQSYWIRPA